jgi:hypothetical protein
MHEAGVLAKLAVQTAGLAGRLNVGALMPASSLQLQEIVCCTASNGLLYLMFRLGEPNLSESI